MSQRMLLRLMPWLVTIGILLVWEAGTYFGKVDRTLLPQPSAVFAVMFKNIALLTEYALFTLMTTVIGFAVAIRVRNAHAQGNRLFTFPQTLLHNF